MAAKKIAVPATPVVITSLVLLVLASGVIGFFVSRSVTPYAVPVEIRDLTPDVPAPASAPVTPEAANGTTIDAVAWNPIKRAELPAVFDQDTLDSWGWQPEEMVSYDTGTVTAGAYRGARLQLVQQHECNRYGSEAELTCADSIMRFLTTDAASFMLAKYSSGPSLDFERPVRAGVNDLDVTIPDLEGPDTITVGSPARALSRGTGRIRNELFNQLTTLPEFQKESAYGRVLQDDQKGSFVIAAPDGGSIDYEYPIPFMPLSILGVTWKDGTSAAGEYTSSLVSGCGSQDYATVMTANLNRYRTSAEAPIEFNPDRDLIAAGTGSNGEVILEFRDAQHPLLLAIYDDEYFGDQENKKSFEEFVRAHAVFFWKDPFGRLIRFYSLEFRPAAECGKPVIYLYPEKTTAVSVRLEPAGGFSYTEPAYGSGWSVTATPQGALTNHADGAAYPYLFWEGRGGLYDKPKQGFVVARSEVHSFLVDKLGLLGLNAKETADFIEFWEPRMQSAPYYFVGFHGNSVMNRLAPLTVTPKPDTVIRILMDFTPLQEPITVTEPSIRTPERNGFTVVEWGGVVE